MNLTFQAIHRWLKNCSLAITSAHFMKTKPLFLCLNVKNDQQTNWRFKNIMVSLSRCDISLTELQSTAVNRTVLINILNSTISKLTAEGSHKINITQVVWNFNAKTDGSLVKIANSFVEITDSIFRESAESSSSTILTAKSSLILMKNTTINSCRAKGGLIVTFQSTLRMEQVSLYGSQCPRNNMDVVDFMVQSNFLKDTEDQETHCFPLFSCYFNCSISITDSYFRNNTACTLISARSNKLSLIRSTFLSNTNKVVVMTGNMNSFHALECIFRRNSKGGVISIVSGFLNMTDSTFSYNIGNVLAMTDRTDLPRPPHLLVNITDCTFSQNDPGIFDLIHFYSIQNNPNFNTNPSRKSFLATFRHCTFYHTKFTAMGFYGDGSRINFQQCIFIFHYAASKRSQGSGMRVEGNSDINFVNSSFHLDIGLVFLFNLEENVSFKFISVDVSGDVFFTAKDHCTLEFLNSSLLCHFPNSTSLPPYSSSAMIFLSSSSTLQLKNCFVQMTNIMVAFSQSQIVISNSALLLKPTTDKMSYSFEKTPPYFDAWNSHFTMSNTIISLEGSTPKGNTVSLVHMWKTTLNLLGIHIAHFKTQSATNFQSRLNFVSSNVTLDSCNFQSVVLHFRQIPESVVPHALVIKNSQVFNDSRCNIYCDTEYVLAKNSSVSLYFQHCFPKCGQPLKTLRIADSTLLLMSPIPAISSLLSWNSLVKFRNVSHNTSKNNFVQDSAAEGLFNLSGCNNQSFPDFLETKFTAGQSLDFCSFLNSIRANQHWSLSL